MRSYVASVYHSSAVFLCWLVICWCSCQIQQDKQTTTKSQQHTPPPHTQTHTDTHIAHYSIDEVWGCLWVEAIQLKGIVACHLVKFMPSIKQLEGELWVGHVGRRDRVSYRIMDFENNYRAGGKYDAVWGEKVIRQSQQSWTKVLGGKSQHLKCWRRDDKNFDVVCQ